MIDRLTILDDLMYRYGDLLDDAGIVQDDTPDGLAPILDEVEALSEANADLSDAVLADVARYKTLDLLTGKFATAINMSDSEGSYQANQEYTNTKSLRDAYYQSIGWALTAQPATEGSGNPPGTIITVYHPTTVDPNDWYRQW